MVTALGHVVLKVRNLDRSAAFYRDVLGLREVARDPADRMVFFTVAGTGKHHDLALVELGPDASRPEPRAVGLAHVAFKVGDDLDALRAMRARLERHGIRLLGMSDHLVSQSLYFPDPDGNVLECYVDGDPALWREDPRIVATTRPLTL